MSSIHMHDTANVSRRHGIPASIGAFLTRHFINLGFTKLLLLHGVVNNLILPDPQDMDPDSEASLPSQSMTYPRLTAAFTTALPYTYHPSLLYQHWLESFHGNMSRLIAGYIRHYP